MDLASSTILSWGDRCTAGMDTCSPQPFIPLVHLPTLCSSIPFIFVYLNYIPILHQFLSSQSLTGLIGSFASYNTWTALSALPLSERFIHPSNCVSIAELGEAQHIPPVASTPKHLSELFPLLPNHPVLPLLFTIL